MIKLQFQTVNEKGGLYHAPHQNSGHRPLRGYCQPDAAGCRILRHLQIDVHVGNLTVGAEIAAAQTALEEYDVILSRGGTAEAIRRCTDLKVVDIPLSVYDILRSIKLAENHNCKYAVIGSRPSLATPRFCARYCAIMWIFIPSTTRKKPALFCRGWKILVARWCCATLSLTHWHRNTAFPPCSSPPVSRAWRMH